MIHLPRCTLASQFLFQALPLLVCSLFPFRPAGSAPWEFPPAFERPHQCQPPNHLLQMSSSGSAIPNRLQLGYLLDVYPSVSPGIWNPSARSPPKLSQYDFFTVSNPTPRDCGIALPHPVRLSRSILVSLSTKSRDHRGGIESWAVYRLRHHDIQPCGVRIGDAGALRHQLLRIKMTV